MNYSPNSLSNKPYYTPQMPHKTPGGPYNTQNQENPFMASNYNNYTKPQYQSLELNMGNPGMMSPSNAGFYDPYNGRHMSVPYPFIPIYLPMQNPGMMPMPGTTSPYNNNNAPYDPNPLAGNTLENKPIFRSDLSPVRDVEQSRIAYEPQGNPPFPLVNDTKESLEKQKRIHKYLENQKELLLQIEEKKRKKAEEEARRKEEEAREEERIRRENAEMMKQDENDAMWRRNLMESISFENKKLAKQKGMLTQDTASTFVIQDSKKTNKGKRARTPIEEVEARMRLEQLEKERVTVEERIIKELPIEVEKTIHSTVENELSDIKKEIIFQQQNLHDQILELKVKFIDIDC
jgi:hypothetical protein